MPLRSTETILAQRAKGRLALRFHRDQASGHTRIVQFYQEGCLKARLPRPQDLAFCDAVTLNISGGVAGGDTLDTAITLGPGAFVCLASQSAERIYRALNAEPAEITTTIELGAGARLDYLPQETIFFDGFALNRRLDIRLTEDAVFLGAESLVFGRQSAGETVRTGRLRDHVSLRRNGVLLLQGMTRLDGGIASILDRKTVADGHIATGSILYAAPDAPAYLDVFRSVLLAQGLKAGASVLDGVLRARIIAPNAAALRNCMVALLDTCRNGRALPRVWQS